MKSIYQFIISMFEAWAEARQMQAQHLLKNRFSNYL